MSPPLDSLPGRLRSRDRSRRLAYWLNASLTLLSVTGFALASWFFATTHPGVSALSPAASLPIASPIVSPATSYPIPGLASALPTPSLAPAPPHAVPVAITGGSHPKP